MTWSDSDLKILKTLAICDRPLTFSELQNMTGYYPKTINERLPKLITVGIVQRIINETYPRSAYVINKDPMVNSSEIKSLYASLAVFKNIMKWDALTARLAAFEKGASLNPAEVHYWRLYPYYLWCLYYGSNGESSFTEQIVVKIYVSRIEEIARQNIHIIKEKLPKEMIESFQMTLQEYLIKSSSHGEALFTKQFPDSLQELAKSFFQFYLNLSMNEVESPSVIAKELVNNRMKKKLFEEKIGKSYPTYILKRFVSVLEQNFST